MISYVLPSHNRHQRLKQTLHCLERLSERAHQPVDGAEIIIVDNASDPPIQAPRSLANGFAVHVHRLEQNMGAAARNVGVQRASRSTGWIIMLDDDSFPHDSAHVQLLLNAHEDVAAIGADISLPNGSREAGGLPEVFIGCGVAIRRSAFIAAGGYDQTFDYYAEEYDLAAKLIRDGWRITHDAQFRIRHEKCTEGRDFNRILHRLVRNNGWVTARYTPEGRLQDELAGLVTRYASIAVKECASRGFALGISELLASIDQQPRHQLNDEQFDRFTGLAQVRTTLKTQVRAGMKVALIEPATPGKNVSAIEQVISECGAVIVEPASAELGIVGTLSPGPMLDAFERYQGDLPLLLPWVPKSADDRTQRHDDCLSTWR